MKILISAIACDPFGGSEGGIGWGWVKTIAMNHEVYCLTAGKYRAAWEKASKEGLVPGNLHVRFLGTEKGWSKNRLFARAQSWFRFFAFNRQVLQAAEEWHREVSFDVAHHVTYATWRVPSPLWRLPVPFVWGPIGGLSVIPGPFRGMLGFPAKAVEMLRDCQTRMTLLSGKFKDCLHRSAHVLAANHETFEGLAVRRGGRPMTVLPSAFLRDEKVERFQPPLYGEPEAGRPLQLFAGGNIEGRKGVDLALRALKQVKKAGIDFRYEVAGGGPEVKRLEKLAKSLGLEANVTFCNGYSGDAYLEKLRQTDIYFLPSFRETTPVTLLEAMLAGCYPIVANASAAGEIVKECGGVAVDVETPEQLVQELAESVIQFERDGRKAVVSADIRQNVIQMFCQERFVESSNAIYADLAGKARS